MHVSRGQFFLSSNIIALTKSGSFSMFDVRCSHPRTYGVRTHLIELISSEVGASLSKPRMVACKRVDLKVLAS